MALLRFYGIRSKDQRVSGARWSPNTPDRPVAGTRRTVRSLEHAGPSGRSSKHDWPPGCWACPLRRSTAGQPTTCSPDVSHKMVVIEWNDLVVIIQSSLDRWPHTDQTGRKKSFIIGRSRRRWNFIRTRKQTEANLEDREDDQRIRKDFVVSTEFRCQTCLLYDIRFYNSAHNLCQLKSIVWTMRKLRAQWTFRSLMI